MGDKYKTIADRAEGYFTDRKSKFYSFVFPVKSEEQVKQILKDLQKKYHDARHIVYAFVLGPEGKIFRASDAGEPSGSSGPPVLRAIQSMGLTDVMVAVVRYFGGKKLGIPGLIHAYGQAALDALQNAKIIEKRVTQKFKVSCDYNQVSKIFSLLEQFETQLVEQHYSDKCHIIVEVPVDNKQRFLSALKQKLWDVLVQEVE